MNSFLKVYAFFLGILAISFLFIAYPPEGTSQKERNQEKFATLEVNDFTLLSVSEKKPEAKIVGKKGVQFEDREEFWGFSVTNYNSNVGGLKNFKTQNNEETLSATHGIKIGNRYSFDEGVKYSNADDMSFEAQKGVFENGVFKAEGEFSIKTKEGEFKGRNLYFDGKTQDFRANQPRGKIWLEQ